MAGSGATINKQEEIRRRAYAIWLDEGQVDGRDREHWRAAEMQIAKEASPPANTKRSAKPKRVGGGG